MDGNSWTETNRDDSIAGIEADSGRAVPHITMSAVTAIPIVANAPFLKFISKSP
jgi:hypothetical protein